LVCLVTSKPRCQLAKKKAAPGCCLRCVFCSLRPSASEPMPPIPTHAAAPPAALHRWRPAHLCSFGDHGFVVETIRPATRSVPCSGRWRTTWPGAMMPFFDHVDIFPRSGAFEPEGSPTCFLEVLPTTTNRSTPAFFPAILADRSFPAAFKHDIVYSLDVGLSRLWNTADRPSVRRSSATPPPCTMPSCHRGAGRVQLAVLDAVCPFSP